MFRESCIPNTNNNIKNHAELYGAVSIDLSTSSMEFSQHQKTHLHLNKQEKKEQKWCRERALRAHQGGCPEQLLLEDHYSRENLSCRV